MNKVKIALIVIVAAACTCVSAEAKKFRWGIKAGMHVENMHFNKEFADKDNRCGFEAGVMGEYLAPLGIGVDLSLMYSNLSTTSLVYNEYGDMESKTKKGNFLSIPLHLKYRLSLPAIKNVVMPYVYTGPNAAIRLGGNSSNFKSANAQWGWDLGLGLEVIKRLQVSAGYTFGINNVARQVFANTSTVNVVSGVKVRNNYWTINVAYLFK